jgi:hypothetical protein
LSGDQLGALLQSVEALAAAVRAQSAQNIPAPQPAQNIPAPQPAQNIPAPQPAQNIPTPVASDNRRPADLAEHLAFDPLAFEHTAIDDFDVVPIAEDRSDLHSSRPLTYSQLRARAQALEYVDLAGFLTSEVVASRRESFSIQSVGGVLTMRAKKPKTIIRSMAEWGQAWARFTLVLLEKFPELATHLVKYQGFIFSLATDYHPAELAIAYDRAFRKNLGLSCSPAYSEPNNPTIFLRVYRTAISAVCGLCSSRSHSTENCSEISTQIPARFKPDQSSPRSDIVRVSPAHTSDTHAQGQKFCYGWNRSGVCGSKFGPDRCQFKHKCALCEGDHQSRRCASSSDNSRPRV